MVPVDDLHCHVAFVQDPCAFVRDAQCAGAHVLAACVTPAEYERLYGFLQGALPFVGAPPEARILKEDVSAPDTKSQILLGLGLHPWWVPEDDAALQKILADFDHLLPITSCVAEVGLDFSPRHERTRSQQLVAFRQIARACAERGGVVLSVHALRAADAALDILEEAGCFAGTAPCTCIFHWFSGSSAELQRARELGCYFSVGPHMLKSKRGRAYAKAIPLERLLLETDEPYVKAEPPATMTVPYTWAQNAAKLEEAFFAIAEARRMDPQALAETLHKTADGVLGAAC